MTTVPGRRGGKQPCSAGIRCGRPATVVRSHGLVAYRGIMGMVSGCRVDQVASLVARCVHFVSCAGARIARVTGWPAGQGRSARGKIESLRATAPFRSSGLTGRFQEVLDEFGREWLAQMDLFAQQGRASSALLQGIVLPRAAIRRRIAKPRQNRGCLRRQVLAGLAVGFASRHRRH